MGYVILWLGLAIAVGVAASNRGRIGGGWFLLAVLTSPLIAGPLVLALPNLRLQRAHEVELAESKICPYCAELIKAEAIACKHCGREIPPPPLAAPTQPIRRAIQPLVAVFVIVTLVIIAFGGHAFWKAITSTVTAAKPETSPQVVPERELSAASTVPNSTQSSTSAPSVPTTSTKPTPAAPVARVSDPKTDNDAEKAALIKVMKDAVAARHGGVLPKTMSEEDTNVAAQAAMKWKAKQAAEKTKRKLDATKVKPLPSSGYGEIAIAKEAITKLMRDPDSAVFGDAFFANDRKSPTGHYVPVVCGTVNGKNGFGGMTGQKHFVAVMSDVGSGVWMEGTTPQNVFAPEWNRYCAGEHN